MIKVKNILVEEINDSRGNPTIKVELKTNQGKFFASVPSGASKGKYEAVELRDEDGKGVKKVIKNIKKIIEPELKDKEFSEQKEIDETLIRLDGTKNKSRLGANALLAISMAGCRALASAKKLSLYQYLNKIFKSKIFKSRLNKIPRPCFNIINGGLHSSNSLDIQEFIIIPWENSYSENLKAGIKIYQSLKKILEKKFGGKKIKIGDEGGFAPLLSKTEEALDFLVEASKGYPKTKFGLDCAANQFLKGRRYFLENRNYDGKELTEFYKNLFKKYPIIYLEDPFGEKDWLNWKKIKKEINNVIIIGDDLLVTNKNRLEKAIKEDCVSGVIIKPNQVGTISETIETAAIAKKAGLKIIVSHRSGETMDDFIADLAVGLGADFIKSGAPGPKERMAKYNRLLEIEKEII